MNIILRITFGLNPKIEAKYQAGGLERHYVKLFLAGVIKRSQNLDSF